jgi:hypothetical protein
MGVSGGRGEEGASNMLHFKTSTQATHSPARRRGRGVVAGMDGFGVL